MRKTRQLQTCLQQSATQEKLYHVVVLTGVIVSDFLTVSVTPCSHHNFMTCYLDGKQQVQHQYTPLALTSRMVCKWFVQQCKRWVSWCRLWQ